MYAEKIKQLQQVFSSPPLGELKMCTPENVARELSVDVNDILALISSGAIMAHNLGNEAYPRWFISGDQIEVCRKEFM